MDEDTYTFIMPSEKVTVTVEYIKIQYKTDTKKIDEAFKQYPQDIRGKYQSAEEMEEALRTEISQVGTAGDGTAAYDVVLQYSEDGKEWITADKTHFPDGGIEVTLPYPEEVRENWEDYYFSVLHLILDPMDTGKTVGEIEAMDVTATEEGVTFTTRSLSPFVMGWEKKVATSGAYRVTGRRYGNAKRQYTFTVTPEDGFDVAEVTAVTSTGRRLEITDNGDGTYTFTMPYSAVKIEVEMARCPSLTFPDLDVTQWYHPYADYVIYHSLMRGTDGGVFAPNGDVTRAQVVTVLWNRENNPTVDYATQFTDVPDGQWYTEAVRWAASEGIVLGYLDGTFQPNKVVTRDEMVTMLYRYEQKHGGGGFIGGSALPLPYADRDKVGDWALDAVAWCTANNVVQGKDGNVFDPQGTAVRTELAAILTRYLKTQE